MTTNIFINYFHPDTALNPSELEDYGFSRIFNRIKKAGVQIEKIELRYVWNTITFTPLGQKPEKEDNPTAEIQIHGEANYQFIIKMKGPTLKSCLEHFSKLVKQKKITDITDSDLELLV